MGQRQPEKVLEQQITLALSRLGALVIPYRQGVMQKADRIIRFGIPGISDLIVCYQGRFIALEIKTEKGRQTDKQKKFESAVKQRGGEYHVVRSVEEAEKIINSDF